jgi:hypothetical protein
VGEPGIRWAAPRAVLSAATSTVTGRQSLHKTGHLYMIQAAPAHQMGMAIMATMYCQKMMAPAGAGAGSRERGWGFV